MAYDPRGSHPIVVDNLSFRWKHERGSRQVVVWHQLDMGRLTIGVPTHLEPTPELIDRVVRLALAGGWDTADHLTVPAASFEPDVEEVDQVFMQPGMEELLDAEGRELQAPDPGPLGPGQASLQVLFVPTFGNAVALTLRADGPRATAHVRCRTWDGLVDVTADADADGVRDAVVRVQASPAEASIGEAFRMDQLPARVIARTHTRDWEGSDEAGTREGPVRTGALAAWRLGLAACADHPDAARALERLHVALGPEEPPWSVRGRVLRLYGTLGWPRGSGALQLLTDGPWIVDARDLQGWPEPFADALVSRTLGHAYPILIVAKGPIATHPTVDAAERALERDAFARLAALLDVAVDPRWRGSAREAVRDGVDARSLGLLEPWLGHGWSEVPWPDALHGYAFADGCVRWGPAPEGPCVVVRAPITWVRFPSGRTVAWSGP